MLPSFVSYYLGSRDEGYEQRPLASRAVEGLYLGLLVTVGFLAVFGTAGIVISAGLRVVAKFIPFAALAVGVTLVLIGLCCWLGEICRSRCPYRSSKSALEIRSRSSCLE